MGIQASSLEGSNHDWSWSSQKNQRQLALSHHLPTSIARAAKEPTSPTAVKSCDIYMRCNHLMVRGPMYHWSNSLRLWLPSDYHLSSCRQGTGKFTNECLKRSHLMRGLENGQSPVQNREPWGPTAKALPKLWLLLLPLVRWGPQQGFNLLTIIPSLVAQIESDQEYWKPDTHKKGRIKKLASVIYPELNLQWFGMHYGKGSIKIQDLIVVKQHFSHNVIILMNKFGGEKTFVVLTDHTTWMV